MGFAEVYDYVDGKLDWLAAGLPTEGALAEVPRADSVARRDMPTCRMDERIGEVRERVRTAGWDACVVVNDERVVFGLLREEELDHEGDEPVELLPPLDTRPHSASALPSRGSLPPGHSRRRPGS